MKVAIIGGGASGLMCAVSIKRNNPDISVTVFERNPRVGKKILATGNGRCNLSNVGISENNYRNFSFASYALNEFSPESNISFFNSLGLFTKTDLCGRVYPLSNKAESVLDSLRNAIRIYDIEVVTDTVIERTEKKGNGFSVCGRFFDKVVIACGGKSSPSHGTDGKGYMLLKSFGHRIIPPYPSLVQLVTGKSPYPRQLKGIRCDVNMTFLSENGNIVKTGELLFADYGLSGIVSMEISAYVSPYLASGKKTADISVDFIPSIKSGDLSGIIRNTALNMGEISALEMMAGFVPGAVGRCILKESFVSPDTKIKELSDKNISSIVKTAKHFPFTVTGTKDFSSAQVTGGGADIKEFDMATMESKKAEGLYAVGEVLDVDGDCGGYNLNWAWSSARLCAESIANEG